MKPVFNVRVYGLVIDNKSDVLVSDEHIMGRNITKFPGGGMHFGEGTLECLMREFREELNMDIRIHKHFYTTDFFQASAFYPDNQVISIYYLGDVPAIEGLKVSSIPFDFPKPDHGAQSFRWLSLKKAHAEDVTFPIDQKVLQMLKDYLGDL